MTNIGDYEIRRPPGKGDMGEVYRAIETKLNRISEPQDRAPEHRWRFPCGDLHDRILRNGGR